MLMTQYKYDVKVVDGGVSTTVTRLVDGAVKVFFTAGHQSTVGLDRLMKSITDDQASSYFPKSRNK